MSGPIGDRYKIEKEIGRGGMGVVYLARDGLLNRDVAIKQLSLDLGEDALFDMKAALERFLMEARAAAGLSHPNAVTLYDVVDANPPYIVMEYVEGRTLRDIVDEEGKQELAVACSVCAGVARALAAAHALGMVHRDIKPDNVMVSTGKAKVLDFGLALFPQKKKGEEEVLLGTPGYMAPEQIIGDEATPSSDVFALACVFLFTLTGEEPFDGDDVRAILSKVLEEELDLSELPVGAGLRPVLTAALSKRPGDRPTAAGLAEGFELGAAESPDRYSSFMDIATAAQESGVIPGWGRMEMDEEPEEQPASPGLPWDEFEKPSAVPQPAGRPPAGRPGVSPQQQPAAPAAPAAPSWGYGARPAAPAGQPGAPGQQLPAPVPSAAGPRPPAPHPQAYPGHSQPAPAPGATAAPVNPSAGAGSAATATPSAVPGAATPSAVPATATPSAVPGAATPSAVPGAATPAAGTAPAYRQPPASGAAWGSGQYSVGHSLGGAGPGVAKGGRGKVALIGVIAIIVVIVVVVAIMLMKGG